MNALFHSVILSKMKLIDFELMLINLNLVFAHFILLSKTLIGAGTFYL